MKRFGIALLLALVTLSGVGTASAFNDDTPLTGPDSIQAPSPLEESRARTTAHRPRAARVVNQRPERQACALGTP